MMTDSENGKWKVLSSQYLIRKPWLTARVDKLEQHFDEHECLTVHLLDRDEVFKRMNDGSMVQSLMLAPLWRYFSETGESSKIQG